VKTLEVIVSAQQQNQICGPGKSFMRRAALSLNQSCARTILRKVFTQPRPISDVENELPDNADDSGVHKGSIAAASPINTPPIRESQRGKLMTHVDWVWDVPRGG
jgi:hypothetical protein